MYRYTFVVYLFSMLTLFACVSETAPANNGDQEIHLNTFGQDQSFLQTHDQGLIVLSNGDDTEGKVLVSAKYQGKVFTSTAEGPEGYSFGWINYPAFASTKLDEHMNAYGGENRCWLGPEGGQFSIFFPKGSKFEFAQWKTPAPIDSEEWKVLQRGASFVSMGKEASMANYLGKTFHLSIERRVSILTDQEIIVQYGDPARRLATVAYQTENSITNRGETAWSRDSGSICIWILDMFPTSDETVILIPYQEHEDKTTDVRSDYFGQVPPNRLEVNEGLVLFMADGTDRGKIGLPPSISSNIAGSIDLKNQVLTLVHFDLVDAAPYLRQEWRLHEDPFNGDVVNAYNDGPLEDGSQMGPFYELESLSPAALLQPGESMSHRHTVYHFKGPLDQIAVLAKEWLAVDLDQVRTFVSQVDR